MFSISVHVERLNNQMKNKFICKAFDGTLVVGYEDKYSHWNIT